MSFEKCKFDPFSLENVLLNNYVNPDKHAFNDLATKLDGLYLLPTEACKHSI